MEEERAPCTAELILGWMEERIWAIRASWETWLLLETRALRRERVYLGLCKEHLFKTSFLDQLELPTITLSSFRGQL